MNESEAESAATPRPREARDRLIVALDVPAAAAALELVDRLGETVRWYKVGMELFYAEGPSLVRRLRERGCEIFLDLKLHDIPNTMGGALRSLAGLGVGLTTVHIPAGAAALREVSKVRDLLLQEGTSAPRLLGVTRLTSLPPPDPTDPMRDILFWAELALDCRLDGWIAPVGAARGLRERFGSEPMLVCPGIRLPDGVRGDQISIGTPEEARSSGADWIVVGRPITQAEDPAEAARAFVQRLAN